jgi:hypothetical protein
MPDPNDERAEDRPIKKPATGEFVDVLDADEDTDAVFAGEA